MPDCKSFVMNGTKLVQEPTLAFLPLNAGFASTTVEAGLTQRRLNDSKSFLFGESDAVPATSFRFL